MKRFSFLAAIALIALVALSQSSTQAVNQSFAERFASASQTGTSGTWSQLATTA